MPAGSPIGSGQGVLNPNNIRIILEYLKDGDPDYPVIVDAGVGTASDVALAMELGCDGVLLNTGIAGARDPLRMARAMRLAIESGRLAAWAGRIPRKLYATASRARPKGCPRVAESIAFSDRARSNRAIFEDIAMPGLDPFPTLGPEGAVARRLSGYEPRQEQLADGPGRRRAIDDAGHLMVEAGTGVGKSFAYLVPAILAATETGKKVVVSTHTISLQEQLLQKDLPFLRR